MPCKCICCRLHINNNKVYTFILQKIGHKAIDYLMKHIESSDSTTAHVAVATIHPMLRKYKDYIQKYKKKLEHAEKTNKNVQVTDLIHDIIMVLEGKRYD